MRMPRTRMPLPTALVEAPLARPSSLPRHPNFFGEILMWVGMGALCCGSFAHPLHWLALLSPAPGWLGVGTTPGGCRGDATARGRGNA